MLDMFGLTVAVGAALLYRTVSRRSREHDERERHRAEWVDCYSTSSG